MAPPGRFIAVEGLDGSGGTTQIQRIARALTERGAQVHVTAEPSGGPIGRLIRQALGDRELLGDGVLPYLFAADRQDHLEREILPRLALGQWVLSDRYLASSLAYQTLAAPFDLVAGLNAAFPPPDLTLFLDLSPEECLRRIEARGLARDRFEQLDLLRQIGAGYGVALGWLAARGHRVAVVDGRGTPDEVFERAFAEVRRCSP